MTIRSNGYEPNMPKKKQTRLQTLLSASKDTLSYLIRGGTEERRDEIIALLEAAVNKAEGPEHAENISSITLVMTTGTAKAFSEALLERDDGSADFLALLDYVNTATRHTKQRVYVRLPIDHYMMRKVKLLLLTTTTKHSDKAFKRLAKQIELEGLSKNPLEVLAELGL